MPGFRLKQATLLAHKIRFGDLYGEEEKEDWAQDFFEEDCIITVPSDTTGAIPADQAGVKIVSTGEFVPMGHWLCRAPSGVFFGMSDALLAELTEPVRG